MKTTKYICLMALTAVLFTACKKEGSGLRPLASLTVVNAAIDIAAARVYAADNPIRWLSIPVADAVNFANTKQFGAFAAGNVIKAVNSADTTKVLFSGSANFNQGQLNTLFLCGQVASYEGVLLAPDNLLNHQDSVVAIRVINLSPNSVPVNVVLTGTPTVNEFTNLVYKQVSDFKQYPAKRTSPAIGFQVRNASTGALLASYTLPTTPVSPYLTVGIANGRFKNITLVIKGLAGTTSGTNAFSVFPVPHY